MSDVEQSGVVSKSSIVIWCDPTANEELNETTKTYLKNSIPNLQIQPDEKECLRYFGRSYIHQKLILITSGRIGREFVPKIHHHENLLSIVIFCQNKENQKDWTPPFSKVKWIVTEYDELLQCVLADLENLSQ